MYDRECPNGHTQVDCWEPIVPPEVACVQCGQQTVRVWWKPSTSPSVVNDGCDVMVKHGLCNPDGTPRRYTSKSEMAQEAKRRGLTNHVVHQPGRSGDRSPHTTKWT